EDFRQFMTLSMEVPVAIERVDTFDKLKRKEKLILVGTKEHFSKYRELVKSPKGYALIKEKQYLVVVGYDEAGVLQGVFNLEAQMKLREAPFLPVNLHLVRESLYERR